MKKNSRDGIRIHLANLLIIRIKDSDQIGQIDHQHGIAATRYTYDSWSTKLLGIATDANGNPIQTKAYSYSNAGDITSIDDQQAGITYNYTYDKLHRLLTVE